MSPKSDPRKAERLAPDDIFERLVHLANTTDLEIGITLHVNGQVVTGKLISGITYWDASAAMLRRRSDGPDHLVDALAGSMEQVAERYRDALGEDGESPATAFVHLREARTLTPQGAIPTDGAFWRGRLASVDGFSLGELRARSSLESSD